MEQFFDNWLPGIVIFLFGVYVFPRVSYVLPRLKNGVQKWLKRQRDDKGERRTSTERWQPPETVQKWLDRLQFLFFGYIFGVIAIMTGFLTLGPLPQEAREIITATYFTEEGLFKGDTAIAVVIPMIPAIIMIIPLLVAAYTEMLVTSWRQWKRAENRRERLTVVLPYGLLAMFGACYLLGYILDRYAF